MVGGVSAVISRVATVSPVL